MQKKKALHDEIARVAHELYEKRTRGHDVHDCHDLDDWLAAEKIVTEKHERHARETAHQVDDIAKPRQGFRRHA
jgi:hypothetical protein